MRQAASVIVVLFLLTSCAVLCLTGKQKPGTGESQVDTSNVLKHVSMNPDESEKYFDWKNLGALDFLEFLRNYKFSIYTEEGTLTDWVVFTEWGIHDDWVKEEELPQLIELLDSTEPCANVTSSISSFLDMNPSTIGNEAAYIIMGYRAGRYPPGLNSTRPKPDIVEIRKWWSEKKYILPNADYNTETPSEACVSGTIIEVEKGSITISDVDNVDGKLLK